MPQHKCFACQAVFKTFHAMMTHKRTAHPSRMPDLPCLYCTKTFSADMRGLLRVHEQQHRRAQALARNITHEREESIRNFKPNLKIVLEPHDDDDNLEDPGELIADPAGSETPSIQEEASGSESPVPSTSSGTVGSAPPTAPNLLCSSSDSSTVVAPSDVLDDRLSLPLRTFQLKSSIYRMSLIGPVFGHSLMILCAMSTIHMYSKVESKDIGTAM